MDHQKRRAPRTPLRCAVHAKRRYREHHAHPNQIIQKTISQAEEPKRYCQQAQSRKKEIEAVKNTGPSQVPSGAVACRVLHAYKSRLPPAPFLQRFLPALHFFSFFHALDEIHLFLLGQLRCAFQRVEGRTIGKEVLFPAAEPEAERFVRAAFAVALEAAFTDRLLHPFPQACSASRWSGLRPEGIINVLSQ